MQRVRDSLEAAHLNVWRDERINPGEDWNNEIEAALKNSNCVLVLATPNSKEAAGVRGEIEFAQERDIFVVPVLVEGDPTTSIPYVLKPTQYVDLRTNYDQEIRNCIASLYERIFGALALRILLENAYSYLPKGSKPRIALFMVDSTDELFIHSVAGVFTQEELQLRYEKGMGAVGMVWEKNEPKGVVVELSRENGETYNLPPKYHEITGHPRTVLAIPIFHRTREELVGILAADSPRRVAESGLTLQSRIEKLTSLTFLIAKFLEN